MPPAWPPHPGARGRRGPGLLGKEQKRREEVGLPLVPPGHAAGALAQEIGVVARMQAQMPQLVRAGV